MKERQLGKAGTYYDQAEALLVAVGSDSQYVRDARNSLCQDGRIELERALLAGDYDDVRENHILAHLL